MKKLKKKLQRQSLNKDSEKIMAKEILKIGYVVALSTEQNYAGASYLDVDDIIFEEFMSRCEDDFEFVEYISCHLERL